MIVFITYTQNHWGKGKSLTEALKNLKKAKGEKFEDYGLAIYEAENFDEIYMTEFSEIHRGKNDKKIYMGKESIA